MDPETRQYYIEVLRYGYSALAQGLVSSLKEIIDVTAFLAMDPDVLQNLSSEANSEGLGPDLITELIG